MINNKQSNSCILCNSMDVVLIQKIKVANIIELYNKSFRVDFKEDFYDEDFINFYRCKTCFVQFFDPKFAGGPKFYEKLQNSRGVYYTRERREFSYAKNFIKTHHDVLEIGSGSGFFAEKLKANSYVGLEFNEKAICEAKKIGVKLINSTIEDYSRKHLNTYDVVCSFHVLEHVMNPKDYIKCSIDALKPNGILIISVPNDDSPLTSNCNHVLNMPPHHVSRWSNRALNNLVNLYKIDLIDYSVHKVSNLTIKDYYRCYLENRLINYLYKKNHVVLNYKKKELIKKITNFLVNKFKFQNKSEVKYIGENITYVFRKKNI